ncbi:MAG: 4Fe-4S dicluster domain-containing protein, partial [Cyanobacteria bacterium P01_G01_bin.38]
MQTSGQLKLKTDLASNGAANAFDHGKGSKGDGFDAQEPPEQNLIDACVHCGFCLTTCPSYRVIGKETDSPRGRIYLMDAINKGEAPLSPTSV